MSDLSEPKYQAMLDFIAAFVDGHGYGPTVREMQNGLGISSTSVVNWRMLILQRDGRLTWEEGLSRTVRVLDPHDDGIDIRLTGEEAQMFHSVMGPGDPKALIMEAVRRNLRTPARRPTTTSG